MRFQIFRVALHGFIQIYLGLFQITEKELGPAEHQEVEIAGFRIQSNRSSHQRDVSVGRPTNVLMLAISA